MIVIQVLYNHLASEQPYRRREINPVVLDCARTWQSSSTSLRIKKAHPTNQMSF